MDSYWASMDRGALFELIINKIGGISLADRDGRYVYVNQGFSEITGYTLPELKGQYVRTIFPNNIMDKVLSTGENLSNVPYQIKNKNQETIQLISSYYPVWDDGVLRGCVFVIFLRNMEQVVELSTNINELLDKLSYYRKSLSEMQNAKYSLKSIIGISEPIRVMKRTILQAARSASTVLIEGETGSGKELVASAVHHHSKRSEKPFIKVNCAAIPKELLESEFLAMRRGLSPERQ